MVSLGLGTAQLGISYGNKSHMPPMTKESAFLILESAMKHKIKYFDTAIDYGASENVLGDFFEFSGFDHIFLTKIPRCDSLIWSSENLFYQFVLENIQKSKLRLKINKHKVLQFHQCDLPFLTSKTVQACFKKIVELGYCEKIGISVYDEQQAIAAVAMPNVSLLQIPCNLIDTRFVASGIQKFFKDSGISLISRSLLMQGLLVNEASLPHCSRVSELRHLKKILLDLSKKHGEKLENLAFDFIFENCANHIDVALIGVDTPSALDENVLKCKNAKLVEDNILESFNEVFEYVKEKNLLNPAAWL